MTEFDAVIAQVGVRFRCRNEECRDFFKNYETRLDLGPRLIAQASDEELENARREIPGISDVYAEFTALYRPLAEFMPSDGGFVFHGACVSYDGGGYLFTAPSGTGKSTHIRLWKQYLGRPIDIVNGDKPIITAREGEPVTIHGTPWAGKERWQKNRRVPLRGICLVTRGKPSVRRANPGDHLGFLLKQTFFCDKEGVNETTLTLMDRVLREVPLWIMECDISREAAKRSFEAMTGADFDSVASGQGE